jgi:hypothetical protein
MERYYGQIESPAGIQEIVVEAPEIRAAYETAARLADLADDGSFCRGVQPLADVADDPSDPRWQTTRCPKCGMKAHRGDRFCGPLRPIEESRLVQTGYGIDPVDGSSTSERAERRRRRS